MQVLCSGLHSNSRNTSKGFNRMNIPAFSLICLNENQRSITFNVEAFSISFLERNELFSTIQFTKASRCSLLNDFFFLLLSSLLQEATNTIK